MQDQISGERFQDQWYSGLSFYVSLKMNHPAQLEFYNPDDVYMTSCGVIFAIVQLFGTSTVPPRLLGQRKVDAGLIHQTFYVNALTSLKNRCYGAPLRRNLVNHDHLNKLA